MKRLSNAPALVIITLRPLLRCRDQAVYRPSFIIRGA